MRLALAVLGGLGLGVLANPVAAQQPPGGDRPPLNAAFFERLDANSDGTITLEEIPEERRDRVARLIERMDADQDGKVTRKEFDEAAARFSPDGQPPRPGARPDSPPARDRRPGQGSTRPGEPPATGATPPGSAPPGAPGRPPFGGPDLFRALDSDRDQKLSKDEMARAVETLMKFDRNGDGSLTPEELAEGLRSEPPQPPGRTPGSPGPRPEPGRGAEEMLRRADKDGDGKLSKDEAPELLRGRFAELDGNSDGFIDKDELAKIGDRVRRMRDQVGEPGRFPGRPPGAPGAPPGEGINDRNRERVAGIMREHDKDSDGRISREEFGADRADEFQRIDANGDGYLTPNEIARGQSDRPSEGRERRERPANKKSEGDDA